MFIHYTPDPDAPRLGQAIRKDLRLVKARRYTSSQQRRVQRFLKPALPQSTPQYVTLY